jgi:predicted dehydrogenase
MIGCGRMGRVHAERLRATGRAELTAVYDVQVSAADALRAALAPGAELCRSPEELLQQPGLEGVVICSPTREHVAQLEAAMQAGLHILCEKPLADSAEGLGRVLALSQQTSRVHMLAYQRRFWGTYRTLRREVLSGRWGRIQAVTSHNTERWQQTIRGSWRDDPAMNPGGFFGDAGSHKVDALFFVTGLEPREVFARSQTNGSRVEVHVSLSAQLSGDVPLTMDFIGSAHFQAEDLTIHCERADLMVRDHRAFIAVDNDVRPLEPLEPTTDPATGFVALLDGRSVNDAPFAAAQPVWALTAMALESARTGQPVVAG